MWFLMACAGTFHAPDGPEPVRSAVWFDVNGMNGIEDPRVPREALLLLLNSTVPCEVPDTEDDPRTGTVDEAAAAEQYWQAQVGSAFTREGALAVALGLFTYEGDWEGRYDIDATALSDAVTLLGGTSRVGYGAWYRVDESVVEDSDGVYFTYTPVDFAYDPAVAAPAWINVSERDDTLVGNFSFTPTELSGSFRAEPCDNQDLLDILLAQIVRLRYLGEG